MREGIGGTALFNIVIFFVILFTGYICISINYSKAFNVKNELVNIIKNQAGVCVGDSGICYNFKLQIQDYFNDVTYHSKGTCDDGWVGYNRNGDLLGSGASNAAFCVKGIRSTDNSVYYQVQLFYQLDLPIIRSMFNLSVSGETPLIYNPYECIVDSYGYPWC